MHILDGQTFKKAKETAKKLTRLKKFEEVLILIVGQILKFFGQ